MPDLKRVVSTQVKIKVIRAIESGIRMQTVAETMGLSLEKVREIRSRSNADIKAVSSFLQTATVRQKKIMAHAVRSSGGNKALRATAGGNARRARARGNAMRAWAGDNARRVCGATQTVRPAPYEYGTGRTAVSELLCRKVPATDVVVRSLEDEFAER